MNNGMLLGANAIAFVGESETKNYRKNKKLNDQLNVKKGVGR